MMCHGCKAAAATDKNGRSTTLQHGFLRHQRTSLRGKLFAYMLGLAGVIVICVFTSLLMLGQFTDVRAHYYEMLDIQLTMLEKEVFDHYEDMVLCGTQLSISASERMDGLLEEEGLAFGDLTNRQELLVGLQDELFEPMKNGLLQANASGAFIIWDTTGYGAAEGANLSRNGLYLQLDRKGSKESTVTVFRGDSTVAREHGAMPHRKWRLEYRITDIPDYERLLGEAVSAAASEAELGDTLEQSFDSEQSFAHEQSFASKSDAESRLGHAHRITPVFRLPGTAQKTVLLTLPMIGEDGTVYGLCGLELGQMHFKEHYSQPTTFERLTCLFMPSAEGRIDFGEALSAGVRNGYYYAPSEPLSVRGTVQLTGSQAAKGLVYFIGENNQYIGVMRRIRLQGDGGYSLLAAMIPKDDYDDAVLINTFELLVTMLLLAFFSVVVCLLLSKRFIMPVTEGLRRLRAGVETQEDDADLPSERSGYREIDELVEYIAARMQSLGEGASGASEGIGGDADMPPYIDRLLGNFIELTGELTPTERSVLWLLIDGHEPRELPELMFVSESTAKHHVLKIYKKLGVSSRGELMLYIAMLRGCGFIDRLQRDE